MLESLQGSFGEGSLMSFSSMNSFSRSNSNPQNIQVGNLLFVTDAEMERIMYGDENIETNINRANPPDSSSDTSSDAPKLTASLPPSAILGTGAFSTVRLAWRKAPGPTHYNDDAVDPALSFDQVANNGEQHESRRSIVRVQSEYSDGDPNESKGELVAVNIIQKSLLKQMKSMQKGPDNRVTVHTAYDNIEREIATMKLLQHPNLVRLYEVIDNAESDRMYMVLEYVSLGEILSNVEGTNLYRRMRYRNKVKGLTPGGYFDEKHAALYFVDIMHGLAYLHRNRICHRDLKPEVCVHFLLVTSFVIDLLFFMNANLFHFTLNHFIHLQQNIM